MIGPEDFEFIIWQNDSYKGTNAPKAGKECWEKAVELAVDFSRWVDEEKKRMKLDALNEYHRLGGPFSWDYPPMEKIFEHYINSK